MTLTNQQIIDQAPAGADDWTHYWEGIYILWNDAAPVLNFVTDCLELGRCHQWCADLDIEDCYTVRSRSDIEALARLERENEALRQGNENLETVADVICYEMEQQGVENFLTFGFKRDDKKFEVTLRYVEGKTTAAVMGELRDEIKALKAERDELSIKAELQLPAYKDLRESFMEGAFWYERSTETGQIALDRAAHKYANDTIQLRTNAGGDL